MNSEISASQLAGEPGNQKTYNLVINGQQETVSDHQLTYEQVVRLAFPAGPFDILYSVSYANPHGHDGTLAPGQKTVVKDGMSFNVVKTNRS
ncbi:multiubiquitin domain-containing protein [Paraburkholderia azotifigens]|uniref:Multiubiquitin domain-containing protein n=1 Tax=Paraburkholderia azotifigens TaxID=2057004 RepID=A0ABU9QVA7_9BURK